MNAQFKLNNREKNLLKILSICILILICKIFIIDDVNLKIEELKNEQEVVEEIKEDKILPIMKEIEKITKIESIEKNTDTVSIKICATYEQAFKVWRILSEDICYFQIDKNDENKEEVECIMQINV